MTIEERWKKEQDQQQCIAEQKQKQDENRMIKRYHRRQVKMRAQYAKVEVKLLIKAIWKMVRQVEE